VSRGKKKGKEAGPGECTVHHPEPRQLCVMFYLTALTGSGGWCNSRAGVLTLIYAVALSLFSLSSLSLARVFQQLHKRQTASWSFSSSELRFISLWCMFDISPPPPLSLSLGSAPVWVCICVCCHILFCMFGLVDTHTHTRTHTLVSEDGFSTSVRNCAILHVHSSCHILAWRSIRGVWVTEATCLCH